MLVRHKSTPVLTVPDVKAASPVILSVIASPLKPEFRGPNVGLLLFEIQVAFPLGGLVAGAVGPAPPPRNVLPVLEYVVRLGLVVLLP